MNFEEFLKFPSFLLGPEERRGYIDFLNDHTLGGVPHIEGWIGGTEGANRAYRRFIFYISVDDYEDMVEYEMDDIHGGIQGGNASRIVNATFGQLWTHRDLTPYKYAYIKKMQGDLFTISGIPTGRVMDVCRTNNFGFLPMFGI